MGKERTVIHTNRSLAHQVKIAEALRDGFTIHGKEAEIEYNATTQADLHVVLGPWFALKPWRHHGNVLYIDRAYWGDPQCISIHWLRNGEKHFTQRNEYRRHPQTKPYKHGERTLILCDYLERPIYMEAIQATVRLHPAEVEPLRTLQQDLDAHDIAIGRRTTALVDAAINGLKVISDDIHSPVYQITGKVSYTARDEWLNNLAWHNWSLDEIENGVMWDALGTTDKP